MIMNCGRPGQIGGTGNGSNNRTAVGVLSNAQRGERLAHGRGERMGL
jgi:hypothetical protein